MKKYKMGQKSFIRMVFLMSFACFFLFAAWFWGDRKEWAEFSICLASYIIFAIWFAFALICQKLDKGFNQLEELLKSQQGNE